MLEIHQSSSASQAKSYFSAELSTGDYYTSEQEIAGQWGGKTAVRLGLSGEVTRDAFNALVDNFDPETGEQLTQRMTENRRPGYDMTFSAPKAFSVLYEYSKDERLLEAFQSSVRDTMEDIETAMHVRVRKGGKNEDRQTSNLVYAEFVHFTARPVEGEAPDPQTHCHCYVPNLSFDEVEGQWKAGEFSYIMQDGNYYEALFHSHLSKRLNDLGLPIERDGKFWTIEGLEKETLKKFSNRTEQIEAYAEEHNIESDKAKSQIGVRLRQGKEKGLSRDDLREVWWDRLEDNERETLDRLSQFEPTDNDPINPKVRAELHTDYALNHRLERQSVVPLNSLKETALREGFGETTPTHIEGAFAARDDLIVRHKQGRDMASTMKVLQEESDIINYTATGYGTEAKLNANFNITKVKDYVNDSEFDLSDEQKKVINGLLTSRHKVMAVQGKAGTGKTTTVAKLVEGIEEGGGSALLLAPTADAAYETLRKDGETYRSKAMQNAQTLARYKVDEKLWESNRGSTLIVDEAGLMSVGDMHSLFDRASKFDNRVILIGDTAQHTSVMRGDAFRILQTEAGLKPLSIEAIRRQQGDYKKAVTALAKGRMEDGFDRLDKQKAIIETPDDEQRYRDLAASYGEAVKEGKKVLTVAPTHAEGAKVTAAIREQLRDDKMLKGDEKNVTRLANLQLTKAEKGKAYNFAEGQIIRYQKNAKGLSGGIKKGEQFSVSKVDKENIWIQGADGKEQQINLAQADRFNVYEARSLALSSGDSVRITEGGKSKDGKRLNNGAIYNVDKVLPSGDVKLSNGWVLDNEKGNFDYGYVTTSVSSQGKTVDKVFIAQSTAHSGAASSEQFYVSVSRAKKEIEIYTDNKELLCDQIKRSHQRLSATELIKENSSSSSGFSQQKISQTLAFYAEHVMDYLKDTASDWLAPFRPHYGEPPKPANWQQKINQERRADKEIEL